MHFILLVAKILVPHYLKILPSLAVPHTYCRSGEHMTKVQLVLMFVLQLTVFLQLEHLLDRMHFIQLPSQPLLQL
jgi:hypothetical protein